MSVLNESAMPAPNKNNPDTPDTLLRLQLVDPNPDGTPSTAAINERRLQVLADKLFDHQRSGLGQAPLSREDFRQLAHALVAGYLHGLPQQIVWPKGPEAGRREDMGKGNMRVGLDSDNDVYVSVWDEEQECWACVEFCNGGAGGGKSPHTRLALIALMCAIERDNVERPEAAWPPVRNAGA